MAIDNLIDQLYDTSPERRREAIVALGKAKDPAALSALADVYRNDQDSELRELALKAGKYIRMHADPVAASAEPEKSRTRAMEPDREVSARDVERAKSLMDQALDQVVKDNRAKAADLLGRAFDTNPKLRSDVVAGNLAADIVAAPLDEAVRILSDPDERADYILSLGGKATGGRKRKNDEVGGRAAADATWGGAFIDLLIYGLANGAVLFILGVVGPQALGEFVSTVQSAGSGGMPGFTDPAMMTLGIGLIALLALGYSLFAMIALLILDGSIHLVASTVMGGDGTFPGLIRKTTLFYTIMIPISLVLQFVPLMMQGNGLEGVFSAISLVFGIGVTYWVSKLIGDNYDFGAGKGCLSLGLGYIVLGIGAFCCMMTLGTALVGMLSGASGGM